MLSWKKAGVSILLTHDAGIRKLNRKYLKHDRATDVIAFGNPKGARPLGARLPGPFCLGDIAISLETAKRMAKELGTSFDYEVHLYLCHGILHLMGYDDHKPKDRARMWRKQDKILRTLYFWKGYERGTDGVPK
ncbi:MAG: rRNA maturation RNase YbeY [Candidatus Omnitrophica bacterium]|nr:rRNA maturation RNase YbeY [Candidatus Omnitrophota bacterium]